MALSNRELAAVRRAVVSVWPDAGPPIKTVINNVANAIDSQINSVTLRNAGNSAEPAVFSDAQLDIIIKEVMKARGS